MIVDGFNGMKMKNILMFIIAGVFCAGFVSRINAQEIQLLEIEFTSLRLQGFDP